MRSIPLLLFSVFTGGLLFGQEEAEERRQLLYLQDGSQIKGVLLRMKEDSVRFRMKGGKVLVISREKVESIKKLPRDGMKGSNKEGGADDANGKGSMGDRSPIYPREGYQHHLSPSFFFNLFSGNARTGLDIYSNHTYRFSPDLAVGVYAGVQFQGGSGKYDLDFLTSYGVLLNGYFLHDSPVAPFWRLQSGFSTEGFDHGLYGLEGFFLDPGFGVTFFYGGNEGRGISLRSDYTFFYLEESYRSNNTRRYRYHGLSMGVIFHF